MGKVIAFYGADHKCGTSMLSQCFAEYISKKYKEFNVLLIHAENGSGEAYSPCVNESLENIRPYLAEKLIESSSIIEKSRYKDNLFIIGGAARPGTANLYHPDMAQYLFSSLSEDFEYVICDTGSEIEHGMTIGSLYGADYVFIILTQDEYSVRRFEWVRPLFEKINIVPTGLIINKYSDVEINSPEIISLRSGIDLNDTFCVRNSKNGRRAQSENKILLSYKDARFEKDFAKLSEAILCRCEHE